MAAAASPHSSGPEVSEKKTLSGRLERARTARFVGRHAEQSLWRSALTSPMPPFAVLWLHGPGGIGKTSLLRRFADIAREGGVTPLLLDAHLLPQQKEPFIALLRGSMELEASSDPLATLHDGRRRALLVDTSEMLGPLEDWLRVDVLPQLPADCLVVFAGRYGPGSAWQGDDGWAELLRSIALRNLSPDESRELLDARGVPDFQHPRLLASTHGHPLALSLVADLVAHSGSDAEAPMDSPHVVKALLERFLRDVPGSEHRTALYAAAHARVTNEALLRDAVPCTQATELYDWLRSLSFVQQTSEGLHLHDTAAEVLDAELRRRDPSAYVALHTRIRRRALLLMQEPSSGERLRGATDLCWMYRFSPIARLVVDWNTIHSLYCTPLAAGDAEQIVAATLRVQGQEAALAQAYWLAQRPDAFSVVRASSTRAIGFIFSLVIERLDEAAAAVDKVLRTTFEYVERTAALRPGEVIHVMHAFDYEHPHGMPRHNWIHVEGTLRWNCTPNLAWSFVKVGRRAQDVVLPILAQFRHFPGPALELGGKQYVLAGHDWRREPLSVLNDRFAEVELHGSLGDYSAQDDPLVVLSEEAFGEAVRGALRDCSKPQALANNPLCRSRLIVELPAELAVPLEAGLAHDQLAAARLNAALKAAAESLATGAKEQKLFQALLHTYIEPAPSQDIAAELVGLPFSTYRRYLGAAVARVTNWLWQREIGGWTSGT